MSSVVVNDQKEIEPDDWSEEARSDGNGWNLHLFVKKDKASQRLCAQCKNVCFDAVELICSYQNDEDDDTEDEHEADYCKDCLAQYFQKHSNKCPVCGHTNAVMKDVPYIRNKIARLKVMCPRSKVLNNNNDTLCEWTGNLSKLQSHLWRECKFGLKKCRYFELGCNHKYIENTQDAQLHQKNYMMQHMELLLKAIKQNSNMDVSPGAPDNTKAVSNAIGKLEQKMDHLSKSIITIQNKLNNILAIKQRPQNKSDDDKDTEDIIDIANEIDIDPQKVIGRCSKCNADIRYLENELLNVYLRSNKWQHMDCDYKPQILNAKDTDQWNDRIKSDAITVDKGRAILRLDGNATAQNHNCFGVITIKYSDDIKEWKVRINHLGQNSNIYIGIINKLKTHQSLIGGDIHKYGISLHANGTVYCLDKETFQSSKSFGQGDIVGIVLDVGNNILLFKVNQDRIMVPVTNLNIDLKNMEWTLFGSLINEGDEIMVCSADDIPNEMKHQLDDEKSEKIVYSCNLCSKLVSQRDFDINNIEWSSDSESWNHGDCELSAYQIPDLSDSNKNTDQFNKLYAAKAMLPLSNKYTFTVNKGSVYQTVFGIMSIHTGVKIWNIRIEHGTSTMFIGIIQTDKIKDAKCNSVPNYGAYRITNNGTITGSQLNIASAISFKTGDSICIILDMNKNTLGFGKNNHQYAMASGAILKDKDFNLFVTLYNVNDSVSIVHSYQDEGIEIKEDKGKVVDQCTQCNKPLYEIDFDRNNIQWNENTNKWQHKACNADRMVPKLQLKDRDQWHDQFTNPSIQIYNKHTAIGGHSTYYNSFGVITVNDGLKKWNIRINAQPSYMYCGVIRSNSIKSKKQGIPSNEGYYLSYNGHIGGGGLSISCGVTWKVGDIVNIILDKHKNTLCFGLNNNNFTYAKGAILSNSSFNLFCTSYYVNSSITILGDNSDDDEKVDSAEVGKCNKCNKDVYEDELKCNNITWNDKQNKWSHKDCNANTAIVYAVPKLGLNDVDQWNRKLSNPIMRLSDPYTFVGGTSSYTNSFGVITVTQSIKTWDLKVNCQPGYMYIGVVDAMYVKGKITGIPSNSYYFQYNGSIQGAASIHTGHKLKVHDRVKIILDMKQNTLCFGINDKNYVYVKGAVLKGRSFKLFCTTYYANSSVSILGNAAVSTGGISKGKALYSCGSCGKKIHEVDFDINNVKYNSNRWYHVQCNWNIPNLSSQQRDQWNRMTSNRNITISNYDAVSTVQSVYQNAFGIISIKQGTKQWNVKVVTGSSSYMAIGVIDSDTIIGKSSGYPSNDGYYLTYNGHIQGSGLSLNVGLTYTTNDVINVHLDISGGVLSFGKNNGSFAIAKGANIKNRSFNLFCTMYYQNNKVSIQ